MAYEIGFVDNTGTEGLAHWQMLLKIKTLAEANGWTTLRYVNPTDGSNRELIMKGVGLSGTEEIFIGFRSYHDVGADYYNLSVAAFTGYVAAAAFTAQPSYMESGVCAHNQRIDYWLRVNAQCITFGLKVGVGSYQHGYTGFFFRYGTPGQHPYPIAVFGMLNGVPATRYSDTSYSMGLKGYIAATAAYNGPNARIRDVAGVWQQVFSAPWNTGMNMRDTGGYYLGKKIVLYQANQVWGELDGVRFISGFNQVVENTCVINGKTNVVLRDVTRTGFADYYLLELS
ncbi:MAG: hypothetical protein ACYCZI_04110 [Metallibacterium scheffleri]